MRNAVQLFCFLILPGFLSCKNKNSEAPLTDCSPIRSGQFEYRGPFGDAKVIIERNDSIQTETESMTGLAMNFRIDWVSPCEYTLKFLSFVDEKMNGVLGTDTLGSSKSKVIKITPNYYIAETVVMGQAGVQKDTILIIR